MTLGQEKGDVKESPESLSDPLGIREGENKAVDIDEKHWLSQKARNVKKDCCQQSSVNKWLPRPALFSPWSVSLVK